MYVMYVVYIHVHTYVKNVICSRCSFAREWGPSERFVILHLIYLHVMCVLTGKG